MKCPYCGDEHKADAKFCPTTGKLLSSGSSCPHCHAPIPDQSVYCPNCGKPVEQVTPEAPVYPIVEKTKVKTPLPIYIGMVVIGILLMAIGFLLIRSSEISIPMQQPTLPVGEFSSSAQKTSIAGSDGTNSTQTMLPVTATSLSTATPSPRPPDPTRSPTVRPSPSPIPVLGIGSTDISKVDGMMMVYVPAGNFYMGSDPTFDSSAAADQTPIHTVYLDAFWIDKTEVTNGMYRKCVDAGFCLPPESDQLPGNRSYYGKTQFENYPVVFVSLEDAQKYCAWVGRQVPTEAQWEKAARGNDKRIYPWGNLLEFTNRLSYGLDKEIGTPSPVGSYPSGASPYGALDMAGNVFEWVGDRYDPHYYSNNFVRNPAGPVYGDYGVVRGGSWVIKEPAKLKTTYRLANPQKNRDGDDGFRCVKMAGP